MIWKDVVGFEGLYLISDKGDVKSLRRNIILKPKIDKDGYHEYCLCINDKRKYKRVHRLVAEAYIDNPNRLPVVNHKNSIKSCNEVSNLEWCTILHNNMHYILNKDDSRNTLSSKTREELLSIIDYYLSNDFSIQSVIDNLSLDCSHEDLRRLLKKQSFQSLNLIEYDVIKKDDYTLAKDILYSFYICNKSQSYIVNEFKVLASYVSRIVNRKRLPEIYDQFFLEYGEYVISK